MERMYGELIEKRRSVRTFDGAELTAPDKAALEDYFGSVSGPFGVPVEFRLFNAKEYGLTSPVIVGEKHYFAAKAKRVPGFEISVGYCFEKVCLYALSLGFGTVMLAASLNRQAFEKAMSVGPDEVMPVASPVGYPAEKMSVRETVMRKGIRADTRKPFETLFFNGGFNAPLSKENAGVFAGALEAVRLAPSAANGQPWRAVVCGDSVHFYEARRMKVSPLGDIQKLDVGIALSHFDVVMNESGVTGGFVLEDPSLAVPPDVYYVATYKTR